MATKTNELAALSRGEGCLGRSQDDEFVFILCARDPDAPAAVKEWASRYKARHRYNGTFDERRQVKYREAIDCANQMEEWRMNQTHPDQVPRERAK